MKLQLSSVAFVAALSLASAAGAGPEAAKQRVAINMKMPPQSTFVLIPLQAGALKRDSGTITNNSPNAPCRKVIRDGQEANVCNGGRWTLTGKQGTLTIRTPAEWVDPGSGGCGVAFGTWNVLRGTGEYTGITGGGRSAYDAHCEKWYARHEGLLRSP
jgi:hypothetical protein